MVRLVTTIVFLSWWAVVQAFFGPVSHKLIAPRRLSSLVMSASTFETRVEKKANSMVGLHVTVPGALTRKAYDDAIAKFAKDKRVQVQGFRQGAKIPQEYLVRAVGGADVVKNAALEILTEDALRGAIEDSGVRPLGQAKLITSAEELINSYEPGKLLLIELELDVIPEITFTQSYKGLKITVEQYPTDEEKIQNAIVNLRKRKVKLIDAAPSTPAKIGDSVFVNLQAFEKNADGTRGAALENIAVGENVEVVMEEGRFLPGVVEGIVGLKAGEKKTISVTFPEKIRDKRLAGMKAEFDIELLSVASREIPEFNDEFANSVREGLTADELMEEVVAAVSSDADIKTKQNRDEAINKALADIVQADMPETWIMDETRRKFANMMSEFSAEGTSEEDIKKMITKENFDKYREVSLPRTISTLKSSAAVAEISRIENIKVDPLDVQDQLELKKAEMRGQEINEEELKDQIESKLISDKVLDWLAEHAEITYIEPQVPELNKK